MASNISTISIDSEVIFVEQLLSEPSPQRNNSPKILNSTEESELHTAEMPTLSSVTTPEQDSVTLDDDYTDPTFPCGFGAQQPIVPSNLNDLNLSPSPFIKLAAMTVVLQNPTQQDNNYSPQSSEP